MHIKKVNIDIAQFLMRQAFEEGYKAAGGLPGRSVANSEKGKWFDFWIVSKTRAILVSNGVISGKDTWR